MAEDREKGYYWIREQTYDPIWKIASWNGKRFIIVDSCCLIRTEVDVGPRILPPKKKEIRREGHYWVKIKNKKNWEVCYWDIEFKCWHVLGTEITYGDDIIKELGPCLSPPEGK